MTPQEALRFAGENPNCDIGKYQKIACQDSRWAYYFALDIDCANIEYCQKYACQVSYYALRFAKDIPGADIAYCQKHACKDIEYVPWFAEDILEADIECCYNFMVTSDRENLTTFILEVL